MKSGGREEEGEQREMCDGGEVAGRIVREGGGKEEGKGRGVREEEKKGGQVGGKGVREKRTLFGT